MQEVSAREFSEIAEKLSEDFEIRFKVKEAPEMEEEKEEEEETESPEEEFSFSNAFGVRSPVSADDAFEDGWIRPVFPLFNRKLLLGDEEDGPRSPVRNIFVAEEEEEVEGEYCEWDGKNAVVSAASECKKSNSTGFSKLWKLREMTTRSHSDGKDAFVFLTAKPKDNNVNTSETTTTEKKKTTTMKKKKGAEVTTPFSEHYATRRAEKEGNKRASYLPYRVGFFANVSGMSRNVHPF